MDKEKSRLALASQRHSLLGETISMLKEIKATPLKKMKLEVTAMILKLEARLEIDKIRLKDII